MPIHNTYNTAIIINGTGTGTSTVEAINRCPTLFHKCAFRLGHEQRPWHLGGLPSQQMQSLPTTKRYHLGAS
jgi:hypothetical protein